VIERYFSVDIETSGPIIGKHSLLALGICRCDDLTRNFSCEVAPISERQDAKAMEIVGKPLRHFFDNGEKPEAAFANLRAWVLEESISASPVFVGFNAAFDWGFVNWYLLTYLGENPFGIAPLDIKAYYAGFAGSTWDETRSSQLPVEFKAGMPHTHDALHDAIEQAQIFNNICAAQRSRR
jgi:hypothetical protein